jgi:hypothetical protein
MNGDGAWVAAFHCTNPHFDGEGARPPNPACRHCKRFGYPSGRTGERICHGCHDGILRKESGS